MIKNNRSDYNLTAIIPLHKCSKFPRRQEVKESFRHQDSEVNHIYIYSAIQHRFPIYDKDTLKIQ